MSEESEQPDEPWTYREITIKRHRFNYVLELREGGVIKGEVTAGNLALALTRAATFFQTGHP